MAAGGTIILVSDLQQGSQLESLSTFAWPADVRLDLRRVTPTSRSNGSLRQVAAQNPPSSDVAEHDSVRIRVSNAADSTDGQFELIWSDLDGRDPTPAQESFQVPPGETRLVRLKRHPRHQRLMLVGDAHPFDNQLFLPHHKPVEREILYLGRDDDAPDRPLYFLRRANFDTAGRTVRLSVPSDLADRSTLRPGNTPLVIVDQSLPPEQANRLRGFSLEGGHILVLLQRETSARGVEGLRSLLQDGTLTVEEAPSHDYCMLHRIDFQHPLFEPFADPRYNDFTKIRFWSHRRVTSEKTDAWQELADFDDFDPAFIEQRNGPGRIWVLTSSWAPNESQLALSTKFVPLLAGMLELADPVSFVSHYFVGQAIPLPTTAQPVTITRPDGKTVSIDVPTESPSFEDTQQPGIYRIQQGETVDEFAVNLSSRESRTSPLDEAELEQLGVPLGQVVTTAERQQLERRERDTALESRQQVWRWLIVTTLLLLGLETWVSGRLAGRRPSTNSAEEPTGSSPDRMTTTAPSSSSTSDFLSSRTSG